MFRNDERPDINFKSNDKVWHILSGPVTDERGSDVSRLSCSPTNEGRGYSGTLDSDSWLSVSARLRVSMALCSMV